MALMQGSRPDNKIGSAHIDLNGVLQTSGGQAYAPRNLIDGFITTGLSVIAIPTGARVAKIYCSVLSRVGVGSSATPAASVAQIQTITKGDATGGTATYTFQGQATAATAWNAAAATFQTNFRAISSMDTSIVCGGGTLDVVPVTVAFNTTTLAGTQPLITVNGASLTGGVNLASMTPVVTVSTAAVTSTGYIEAGTEHIFSLNYQTAPLDSFVYITGDSTTGTFRVSWYS